MTRVIFSATPLPNTPIALGSMRPTSNGSQPDLILVSIDDNGHTHTTRAFNTETAEQLNAWLNGFEAQLRQMSEINFDFSVHVLMLLYKELVEKRVEKKNEGLNEEFWDKVESTD
ncbi:hypothetical protein MVEN_01136000 [Mycena venus]|uniref:PH domain-containing protein n=1 Tax=Mycena venus TaxID=2733690 RepID=A0A8H6Y5A8_9AGAR|nr:hypothetical protein MVEN_01136000 [Mycena venus]